MNPETLLGLIEPGFGWILVLAYGWYEINFGRISEHLNRVDRKITAMIHTIRAISTAINTDRDIDLAAVEEHLVGEEDLTANEFLKDKDIVPDGGEREPEPEDGDNPE